MGDHVEWVIIIIGLTPVQSVCMQFMIFRFFFSFRRTAAFHSVNVLVSVHCKYIY